VCFQCFRDSSLPIHKRTYRYSRAQDLTRHFRTKRLKNRESSKQVGCICCKIAPQYKMHFRNHTVVGELDPSSLITLVALGKLYIDSGGASSLLYNVNHEHTHSIHQSIIQLAANTHCRSCISESCTRTAHAINTSTIQKGKLCIHRHIYEYTCPLNVHTYC
jgi:hypothetical protein